MACVITLTVTLLLCVFIYKLYTYIRALQLPRLQDRYVIVTGCDSGFGKRAAVKMDALGIRVIATCYTEKGAAELRQGVSDRMHVFIMDMRDDDSVQNVKTQVQEVLPPKKGVWALINNAGIMDSVGFLDWLTISDYEPLIDVILYGTIRVTSNFLPLIMPERGRVVITSSVVARSPNSPFGAYSVAKGALNTYAVCLRRELWSRGVSVHVIEPSGHSTPMTTTNFTNELIRKSWNKTTGQVKEYYGPDYGEKLIAAMGSLNGMLMTPEIVADTYIHSVTSRYPYLRYKIGVMSMVSGLLCLLPDWAVDFISCTIFSPWPSPEGVAVKPRRS